MNEYIDRDALLDDISAAVKHRGMWEIIGQTLIRYVKRQPSADVAPVTRCKDCKHRYSDSWCEYVDDDDNFYCARGKRKEGAG